jgi:hypothetical protein
VKEMISKLSNIGKLLVQINFYVAVIVLIGFCLLSVSDDYSLFDFNEDLYGALDNNLRMMMVYLGLIEAMVFAYCWLIKKFQAMALVGLFLVLMIESIEFYGEVNTVEIDSSLPLFFLYTGLSHVAFGVMCIMDANRFRRDAEEIDR